MNRTIRATLLAAACCAVLSGSAGAVTSVTNGPRPAPATAPAAHVESVPPAYLPGVALAPRMVGEPKHLSIPAIGVEEDLYGVGLKPDGAMETPAFGDAGWYDRGPRPGASGPAVVVAHVHGPGGDDVFARLDELRRGDRISISRTDGASVFVVDAVERVPKTALPYSRIWKKTTAPVLRLITCGGEPDPVTRMYPDNTVVYAHLGA